MYNVHPTDSPKQSFRCLDLRSRAKSVIVLDVDEQRVNNALKSNFESLLTGCLDLLKLNSEHAFSLDG